MRALNFVMQGALGGGGPRTLRADSLGKTLGGALVRMEIDVPDRSRLAGAPVPTLAWADEILRATPASLTSPAGRAGLVSGR